MTDPNAGSEQTWVHIAHVIRTQGRRGELLAEILSDFPNRFAEMRNAFLWRSDHLPVKPILLEHSWLHKGKVVLKFAQVDSISAAEELRGADLVISVDDRIPLESDEVYISDLIGCECLDVTSNAASPCRVLGTIRDVIRQQQTTDLLVVAGADGIAYEIPFAKAYVVKLDVAARRIELHLPAGLLEVNAPLTEEERLVRESLPESEA